MVKLVVAVLQPYIPFPSSHHDHHCVRVKSGRNCLEEYEGKVGVVEASRDMEKRKKSQEIFSEINVPLFILTNYPSE